MIQDWYFGMAGLLYSVVLVPTMRDPKSEVPRTTSVLTAATLSCSALAYATLGMWWASASCVIGASTWAFLARYRPIRPRVTEDALGEVAVDMAITEHEWELVQQYRTIREQGFQSGGTVSGCGGCPSAGTAPSEPV